MLKFKKIEIEDAEIISRYITDDGEYSCENAFVNLLVWQCRFNNMAAFCEGQLIIKSGPENEPFFRLPFGSDFEKGMYLIRKYCGKEHPEFWAQEGAKLNLFRELYGNKYTFTENRDAFDYIYLQNDLAALSGKKYHSKRNHISAFSKKHKWWYEPITESNINAVRLCAERWYRENTFRADRHLFCEKNGVQIMLENMDRLGILGGAIYMGEEVAAFTLGSPVNSEVFDIHIEKALPEYAEAYTVINREFALNALGGYKYINREDDMGLEGLRKAKLSYKPAILLEKYSCRPNLLNNG